MRRYFDRPHLVFLVFSRAVGFGVDTFFGRLSHMQYIQIGIVSVPGAAKVVCAHNIFKSKGVKSILQVTVKQNIFISLTLNLSPLPLW